MPPRGGRPSSSSRGGTAATQCLWGFLPSLAVLAHPSRTGEMDPEQLLQMVEQKMEQSNQALLVQVQELMKQAFSTFGAAANQPGMAPLPPRQQGNEHGPSGANHVRVRHRLIWMTSHQTTHQSCNGQLFYSPTKPHYKRPLASKSGRCWQHHRRCNSSSMTNKPSGCIQAFLKPQCPQRHLPTNGFLKHKLKLNLQCI